MSGSSTFDTEKKIKKRKQKNLARRMRLQATEVSLNVRVKRLVEVSPSISRPQKSRLPVTERRTARTSLTFENIQQPPVNPSYVEVAACFLTTLSYIKL